METGCWFISSCDKTLPASVFRLFEHEIKGKTYEMDQTLLNLLFISFAALHRVCSK